MFSTADVLACFHGCGPTPNPYWIEYIVTLLVLYLGFAQWRDRRPPALPLLRVYIGCAALFAFVLAIVQAAVTLESHRLTCRWILEASWLVTAGLYLEMLLGSRCARLAKARALRRPRSDV